MSTSERLLVKIPKIPTRVIRTLLLKYCNVSKIKYNHGETFSLLLSVCLIRSVATLFDLSHLVSSRSRQKSDKAPDIFDFYFNVGYIALVRPDESWRE